MRRSLLALTFLAVALVPAACQSKTTYERTAQIRSGALIKKELRSYHTIQSEYDGKVGYLKVFDVREAGGPVYPWRYVYDLEWNELGFIDQSGTAFKFHQYPTFQQEIHDTTVRVDRMRADSTENNVMRLLGLDLSRDNVTFPLASASDIGD